MSIEKQELLNSIESLPEELASQVLDYMEYVKFMYVINQAPDSVVIKDKDDLIKKLEKGIESTNNGDVYSLDEVFDEVQKI
ncbi:MAG: hypothetical protein OSJ66_07115 [Clostridia bacterium]|nr:hypothetical protein [Clostridia bacterium]